MSKYTVLAILKMFGLPVFAILLFGGLTDWFNIDASTWNFPWLVAIPFSIGAFHYLFVLVRTIYFYEKPKECLIFQLKLTRFNMRINNAQPIPILRSWHLNQARAACEKGVGGFLNYPLHKIVHYSWGIGATVAQALSKIKGPKTVQRFSFKACPVLNYENFINYTLYLEGFLGTSPHKVNFELRKSVLALKPVIRAGLFWSFSKTVVYTMCAILLPQLF